jgi:hypothetical protein
MSTTIKDFGRHSDRFGDIPFYYGFPIKFWFKSHMLIPDDVLTWCRRNCTGFYKVVAYTHEDSKKKPGTKTFAEKIMYVDKIYLEKEEDAALIKLTFKVLDQKISRPRLEVVKRPRKTAEEKAMNPNSPEAILLATRRHAASLKAAKKASATAKKTTVKTPAAPVTPKASAKTLKAAQADGNNGLVVHAIK